MLIHPWDAATDVAEWQDWLAATDRFGILAVSNLDPALAPLLASCWSSWPAPPPNAAADASHPAAPAPARLA